MEVEATVKGLRVDLREAVWRKSSASGPHCDNCVEVAFVDDAIAVRDSKKPVGPMLAYSAESWRVFTDQAQLGHFDTRKL